MHSLGNVVVVGGCGFLGHRIVDLLHSKYTCKISVVDLRTNRNRHPESNRVAYFDGDITDVDALTSIFEKEKPTVVIHTASPPAVGNPPKEILRRVNVDGTRCVVEACQRTNVKALVFTSSASIISDNVSDLLNADERWPVLIGAAQTSYYSQTKAEAEALVLAANRAAPSKLLTCAIRPAGILGEGDGQLTPGLLKIYFENKHGFQVGDNNNLFDFTHVDNVAHAHLLAASALLATSQKATAPLDHEKVDGEAFFITNDSPIYFWDFARMTWKAAGLQKGTEHVWIIGRGLGLTLAMIVENVMRVFGKQATFTTLGVKFSCMTRYYNISKAKKRLGYTPIVSLQEGIERGVAWALEQRKAASEKKEQ